MYISIVLSIVLVLLSPYYWRMRKEQDPTDDVVGDARAFLRVVVVVVVVLGAARRRRLFRIPKRANALRFCSG